MFLYSLGQTQTPLEKYLELWLKHPERDLGIILHDYIHRYNDIITLSSIRECELINTGLSYLVQQIETPLGYIIESNILELANLMIKDNIREEVYDDLNENTIPLIRNILLELIKTNYSGNYLHIDFPLMQLLANYENKAGFHLFMTLVKNNYKSASEGWLSIALNDDEKSRLLVAHVGSDFPLNNIGFQYIRSCNHLMQHKLIQSHPYNCAAGYTIIYDHLCTSSTSWEVSLKVIPFLNQAYQEQLLGLDGLHNKEIALGLAIIGAQLGRSSSIQRLAAFTLDERYSSVAINYLHDLNLSERIPREAQRFEQQVLNQMSDWLSSPEAFGMLPDKVEMIYSIKLFWPPTKDERILSIVRYTYKQFYDENTDEVGMGVVGSKTCAIPGIDYILTLTPLQILALHCNYELGKEHYEVLSSGIRLIKQHNPAINF